mgnify:CR=1 FL=1
MNTAETVTPSVAPFSGVIVVLSGGRFVEIVSSDPTLHGTPVIVVNYGQGTGVVQLNDGSKITADIGFTEVEGSNFVSITAGRG